MKRRLVTQRIMTDVFICEDIADEDVNEIKALMEDNAIESAESSTAHNPVLIGSVVERESHTLSEATLLTSNEIKP